MTSNRCRVDRIPPGLADLGMVTEIIQSGSKSFAWAGRFLAPEVRLRAFALYAWCRWVDDLVDEGESGEAQREALRRLLGSVTALREGRVQPEAQVLKDLGDRVGLPAEYPLQLLLGMQMDLDGFIYKTQSDLILYCYRAAGVVGLMMAHCLGVSDPRAMKAACDLGIAMQMSNVARDIREDWLRGRVYLPTDWLEGLEPDEILDSENRQVLFRAVDRLVRLADEFYASGRMGLPYLDRRSGFAIDVASRVYQRIGHRVMASWPDSLFQRTVTSGSEKVLDAFRAIPQLWQGRNFDGGLSAQLPFYVPAQVAGKI